MFLNDAFWPLWDAIRLDLPFGVSVVADLTEVVSNRLIYDFFVWSVSLDLSIRFLVLIVHFLLFNVSIFNFTRDQLLTSDHLLQKHLLCKEAVLLVFDHVTG